jgi:hypothetical protein
MVNGQHEVMNIYGGTTGQLIEPHNNGAKESHVLLN